jgi:hypothetical protein
VNLDYLYKGPELKRVLLAVDDLRGLPQKAPPARERRTLPQRE